MGMARIIRIPRPFEWSMRDSREQDARRRPEAFGGGFMMSSLFFFPARFSSYAPLPCLRVNLGASAVTSDVWG